MGPSRDLPDSFYVILVIIVRRLVLTIFDIFCAKMKNDGRKYFSLGGYTVAPGPGGRFKKKQLASKKIAGRK